MFGKKKSAPKKGDGGEKKRSPMNMGMFGMYGDEDDDMMADSTDPSLEAELNQLLGGGGGGGRKKAPPPKPKSKQLMDWSDLDAQISASMKDDIDDDEMDLDDAGDLEAELEGLVSDEEDEALSVPTPNKRRSPSPQPQAAGGGQLQMLQDRKKNYETAIQNAQAKGESSKVRRYQRGMKTLDDMLKKAKAGKPVDEEELPPPVATGKPASSTPTPTSQGTPPSTASATPPSINVTEPMKTGSPTRAPPPPKPATPTKPASPPKPAPAAASSAQAGDPKVMEMLLHKQQEFKKAAFTAKNAGDKVNAVKYFRIIKQFDVVIAAAKEGKPVDLSQMPNPPSSTTAAATQPPAKTPATSPPAAPAQSTPTPVAPAGPKGIPVPKTLLEGLIQRQQKYQSSADQAKAEGNGSKSRRMMRIVKQYDDAIRATKAGRQVNVAELPVPMGYPPLPGMNEKPQDISDVLEQAGSIKLDTDEGAGQQPQVVQASMAAAAVRQPARPPPSPQQLKTPKSPGRSPSPKRTEGGQRQSAYQQQIEFLVNRQAAFKEAAIEAKKKGDKETAIDLIKKMKGFEPMIEQARNGLKVDITKVPQPPIVRKPESRAVNDSEFEILGDGKHHEDDGEIYKTLLDTLQEQIKKARAYSEQFTHSGDVNGANMFDHLSSDSQRDFDFVKNLKRHGDPPPRYYFDNKTFESVHINPELNSAELELIIIQLLDIDGKDLKPFVEWEMPFPHDDPHKGRTEEVKSVGKFQYDANFRIPIVRKNKSFQRAIKNKAVKFEVMQRGGFLRSDKSLGSASVKLGPLETSCEIRAVEPLKEGRAIIGRIEVKIRMRTPLISSESKTITEKWLVVSHEHVTRRTAAPRPSQGKAQAHSASSASKQTSPNKETGRHPKIHGSVEVLALERRMVEAKVKDLQSKGQRPPVSVLQNQQSVTTKLNTTQKFLREGGVNAKRVYVQFLKSEIGVLTKEAQMNVKQGKHDQAKFSLTKRKMIENEIQKMAPSDTYL